MAPGALPRVGDQRPALPGHSAMSAGLTAAQAQAAAHDGPILVLAGAGSGKTKTLTAAVGWRIDVLGVPASRILAVTFTNKAAAEMRGRVQAMLGGGPAPHWLGTFHGLGARQLRYEPEVASLRHGFEILDAADSQRLVKRSMAALGIDPRPGAEGGGFSPKEVCKTISRLKDKLVTSDQVVAYMEATIASAVGAQIDATGARVMAVVYVEYQRRLREANAADFGDYPE